MGCAISKSHHRIIDSSTFRQNSTSIEIVNNAAQSLSEYFASENCPEPREVPKCIFVFGGSGSNKGEFIWDLMREHNEDTSPDKPYGYVYIDVERLIASNIKLRIEQLTDGISECLPRDPDESFNDPDSSTHEQGSLIEATDELQNNVKMDGIKPYLTEFANVVTNNWVLGLIEQEIGRKTSEESEQLNEKTVFLVNLIPNRINMFKNCLYLKQSPNFGNFTLNYFAVHLVRSDCKKKDLDLVANTSNFEDVNQNFINYFRNINKLLEIKIQASKTKRKIKLSRSKNAIKIKTTDDILEFIKSDKKDNIELDISLFESSQNIRSSLLFLVNNQIDISDDEVLIVEDNETNYDTIRRFVQNYIKATDLVSS